MDFKVVLIILLSVFVTLGASLLPGPRDWMRSVTQRPFLAFCILLLFLSAFLGQPRGVQMVSEGPVDAVRLARMLLLSALAVMAAAGVAFSRRRRISSGPGIKWMAVYAGFAMLSAVYSPIPFLSLWKGFEVLAVVAVGLFIGTRLQTEDDMQHAINIILLALWFLVVSALAGAALVPAEAFSDLQLKGPMAFSLHGVYPFGNANTLSQIAGIVAAFSFAWVARPKRPYGTAGFSIVLLFSLVCLVLSHSRTSMAAFFASAILVLFAFRKVFLMIGLVWFGLLFVIFGAVKRYFMPYIMRGQSSVGFTTLSGRTMFWPEVMKRISEAPLIGHGFYASQRVIWGIPTVDSTYLEVLLGIGIIGGILICMPLLCAMFSLWKTRPHGFGRQESTGLSFIWLELMTFFLFLFVRSLTGPSFEILHVDLVIFVVFLVSSYRLRKIMADSRLQD
jgi:O-antigen ligase